MVADKCFQEVYEEKVREVLNPQKEQIMRMRCRLLTTNALH